MGNTAQEWRIHLKLVPLYRTPGKSHWSFFNMAQRLSEIFSKEGILRKFLKDIDTDYEAAMSAMFAQFDNFQGIPVQSMPKSEIRSNHSRRAGNDAFYEKFYGDALSMYNIAIMQAPPESYALVQAYTNRSVLLIKLVRPNECLKDIETCLKMPCVGDLKKKLLDRKLTCESMPKTIYGDPGYEKYFSISGEAHTTIPCASNTIDIIDGKIVACRDIKAGEVISAETAYASCLKSTEMELCCHHCHRFSFNLIPCEFCCFVLFCNEDCKKGSWEEVHKIECEIYKIVVINNCNFRLSLHAVLKALVMFDSDWNKLMSTVKEAEKSKGYIDGPYESVTYQNLCTQPNYEHLPRRGRLFECAMNTAVIVHTLSRIPSLLPANKKEKKKVMAFLGKQLIFHHENSTQMGISGGIIQTDKASDAVLTIISEKAIGLFPFTRQFKHSCHPNAETFGLFKKKAVVAIRNIPKGSEITIPYWRHFLNKPTVERKRFLFLNYGFVCKCNACLYDWVVQETDDVLLEKLSPSKQAIMTKIGIVEDYKRDFRDRISECSHNLEFDFIIEGLREFSDSPNSSYYKMFLELFQSCYLVFYARVAEQFAIGTVDPNAMADD